jgi:hypothetical protein
MLYSSASRRLANLIHNTHAASDGHDDHDDILLVQDVHKLEAKLMEATLELDRKDKEIEQLRSLDAQKQEHLEAKTREFESVTAQLEDRIQDIESKCQERLSITEEMRAHSNALEKKLQDQIALTTALEAQLTKAQTAFDERGRTVESLENHLKATQSSLESRATELQGLKSIFGEPDVITDVDAVKLVSALNAEIFQTGALLAESFGSVAPRALEGLDNRTACGRVRQMFGQRLVDLLKSVRHDENPVLLRVAFQACMVVFSDWISAAWHFQSEPAPQFFGEVYRNVWLSGSSSVPDLNVREHDSCHKQKNKPSPEDGVLSLVATFNNS